MNTGMHLSDSAYLPYCTPFVEIELITETFNRLRNGELLEVRGYPDGSGSLGARS